MLWNGRREIPILLQCEEASDMLHAGPKGILLPIRFVDVWLSGQDADGK
jgi:hypothetical protein